MDEKDKVQILLKEYDALRAEILQRISHRFSFLGLTGAVGGYAFFVAKDLSTYQTVVLMMGTLALFGVWWQLGNLIARCSHRISEIEKTVNSIAGEPLLTWEHQKLGTRTFHRMHGANFRSQLLTTAYTTDLALYLVLRQAPVDHLSRSLPGSTRQGPCPLEISQAFYGAPIRHGPQWSMRREKRYRPTTIRNACDRVP